MKETRVLSQLFTEPSAHPGRRLLHLASRARRTSGARTGRGADCGAAHRRKAARNDAARRLRDGRSTTIGLVVLDVRNPFVTEIARGAEDRAAEVGLTVTPRHSRPPVSPQPSWDRPR